MTARVLLAAFVVIAADDAAAQSAVGPAAVLDAVDRWMPSLARADQDIRAAEGDAMAATGAFDLTVKAESAIERGYYDNETLRLTAEQPIAPLGLSAYGGYRLGRGTYGPYDGKAQTLSNGELFAGLSVPLLRDRATDARRTDLRITTAGVRAAAAGADRLRLSIYREALARYWDAVAAAEQWRMSDALLRLAEDRSRQLAGAVALGQVAAVERTDNERAVRQRRAAAIAARRAFEQQAIELSMFLRDDAGTPRLAAAEALRLPAGADAWPPPDERAIVQQALAARPELRALDARREQLQATERLAWNTRLPQLNLFSETARDFGTGLESRTGAGVRAGVFFSVPLQRRRATGQALRAQAALTGLELERRLLVDRVTADVRDAISAWRAADEAVLAVREEVVLARELEQLERERFALGDSTQFMVNLRELATADATLRDIRAVADRLKARLALDAATGELLTRARP